jgi:hypothetical protein
MHGEWNDYGRLLPKETVVKERLLEIVSGAMLAEPNAEAA